MRSSKVSLINGLHFRGSTAAENHQDHQGKPVALWLCQCGTEFTADSVFCRGCGQKRTDDVSWRPTGVPVWKMHTPRLSTSGKIKDNSFVRIMDRGMPFGQSSGKFNVERWASTTEIWHIYQLYCRDWYHTFLEMRVAVHILAYASIYLSLYLLFAPAYLLISEPCGLELEGKFGKAYYLSLQTMSTIGYGVPDSYFNDCWEGTIVLTVHSLVQFVANAFLIGSFFVRMTRPESRKNTVLFSDKAILNEHEGNVYFSFRVIEAKNHDLLEAQIRLYCVREHKRLYHCVPMRLHQPDDVLGGMISLKVPALVVHRIDNWSPMAPNSMDRTKFGNRRFLETTLPRQMAQPTGLEAPQRRADTENGTRVGCFCPVCGDDFPTLESLTRHTEYLAAQDMANGFPEHVSHGTFLESEIEDLGWRVHSNPTRFSDSDAPTGVQPAVITKEDLTELFRTSHVEIIAVLEGIEPSTSSVVQAQHSWLMPVDAEWNVNYEDCVRMGTPSRPCVVDLGSFHKVHKPRGKKRSLSPEVATEMSWMAKAEAQISDADTSFWNKKTVSGVSVGSFFSEKNQMMNWSGRSHAEGTGDDVITL